MVKAARAFERSQPYLPLPSDSLRSLYYLPPPLKWAGGKRWQVPHLRKYWESESHRRLVEPFCGGLAVTLGLLPEQALLNDINPHLVNFYRWLKRGLTISIEMANEEALFYAHRMRFNQLLCSGKAETKEAASLFYYLNRTGYNGLCRFNRSGEFNVPFGSYKKINYIRNFIAYKAAVANWEFTSSTFNRIPLGRNDFVYADPPYDVEFTQYSKDGFGWEDQVKTAEWLGKHPGPVVLSNQATKRIVQLYGKLGYKLIKLNAPRRISCTGDRSPAEEVLALKNLG
ncbi:MAG: Dam family site-specific DNA-(adenine-N6)-methyltransferase [Acidobacteriota bacterium]|nr:Dam family site-specific DNA-(adenine-N6)-methyltransferase [Acidobacteriota bacterium]